MTDVPNAYQQLLERGHDFAWSGNWRDAAGAYRQAVSVRQDDAVAFLNLGLALINAGEPREALRAYQRALTLNPNDVTAMQKVAELHGSLGERLQAASTYLLLADRYMQLRQPAQAVQSWQRVIQFEPSNRLAFRRLADAYQRGRRYDLAAQALTGLARLHLDANETKEAAALAQQALDLQKDFAPARQLLTLLKAAQRERAGAATPNEEALSFADHPGDTPNEVGDDSAAPGTNPVEGVLRRAQERLAALVFDEGANRPEVGASIARALDLHARGRLEEAARTYEAVLQTRGGVPELHVALGALYQQLFRFGDAIQQWEFLQDNSDYGTVAHFAIGQASWEQGRMDEAVQHFEQAVERLNLVATEHAQVDDALGIYAGLVEAYKAMGNREQAELTVANMSDLLSSQGWNDKLRLWQDRYGDGAGVPVEPLDSETSVRVSKALETAEAYRAEGQVSAAIDELYWVLTEAPFYLPLHLMLAELFAEDLRLDAAVAKLNTVADTYLIRSNPSQAIRALKRALEIAPVEQGVRGKLIDLLMKHGEIDEAIHHYIQLAEGFYELAQIDRAIEMLNEALRLSPRAHLQQEWQSQVQRRLADIYLQRLDWRRAAAAFEGVYAVRPDDVEVTQQLADLYATKLGMPDRAQAVVAGSVEYLQAHDGLPEAVQLVQSQLAERQEDADLLKLLGELQLSAGDLEAAAQSWEQGVELLVRQGERAQATALLRRIVALHTAREQRYRAMLNHLMKMS